MSRRSLRRSGVEALSIAAALNAGPLYAQDAETARRELVQQAQAARASGDNARALELSERAAQMRMSTSLRYFIAQCHESLGTTSPTHLPQAFNYAARCVQEASADAALQYRDRIFGECGAIVARTTPLVARVVVRGDDAALLVRVNGAVLVPSERGAAYAVMPGDVAVEVQGRDGQVRTLSVRVAAGETREVSLANSAVPQRSDARASAPLSAATAHAARPSTTRAAPGVGPWVLLGSGLAVAALGGVFFGLQGAAVSDRDALCPRTAGGQDACGSAADRERALSLHADAELYNALGWAAVGVGAAVALGGAAWRIFAQPSTERHGAIRVGVVALGDGALLGVGGRLP